MQTQTVAIAAAVLVVLSMGAPALAATNDGLAVNVTQADQTVTIGVTDNGTAAANATVDVTVLEEIEDNHSTNGNKTTNETDVSDNETLKNTNETASPETNVSIAGTYETDENGTVSLAVPSSAVRVNVTATLDNRTVSTTTTLYAAGEDGKADAFGQRVQAFVHKLLDTGERGPGIGKAVSDFVTGHNPGAANRPEHAGPPAHADHNATADAGNATDDKRGHPENASTSNHAADTGHRDQPNHADDNETTTGQADENATDQADERDNGHTGKQGKQTDDDTDHGPPAYAGPRN